MAVRAAVIPQAAEAPVPQPGPALARPLAGLLLYTIYLTFYFSFLYPLNLSGSPGRLARSE